MRLSLSLDARSAAIPERLACSNYWLDMEASCDNSNSVTTLKPRGLEG